MIKSSHHFLLASLLAQIVLLGGCATSTMDIVNKPESKPQISKSLAMKSEKGLKRKVAIARFTNETKHGNSFLLDKHNDRVGKQAMDILSARLTDTGQFLMLERADLGKVQAEKDMSKLSAAVVGADYLIVGSVSEFGRTTVSEVGIFSRNKKQKANASVNVRLIDVATGQIVFSQEGSGKALSEANRVFGVGERAGYDSALDDKALSAAISKLVSNLVGNLMDKPWSAFILDQQEGQVIISGGKSQGIKVGDELMVMKKGREIKNPQTGIMVELPRSKVGSIKVLSFSGTGNNEVSICSMTAGSLSGTKMEDLIVQEM